MSVSIYANVQRRLTPKNLNAVRLYNDLIEGNFTPPVEMVEGLKSLLGKDACDEWGHESLVIASQAGDLVESNMKHEGDVMYGEGMIIQVADLPSNAVALRIYAVA